MDFIEGNQGDLLFQESKNSIEQNHRLPSRTAQNLQIRFLTRHEIIVSLKFPVEPCNFEMVVFQFVFSIFFLGIDLYVL